MQRDILAVNNSEQSNNNTQQLQFQIQQRGQLQSKQLEKQYQQSLLNYQTEYFQTEQTLKIQLIQVQNQLRLRQLQLQQTQTPTQQQQPAQQFQIQQRSPDLSQHLSGQSPQ